MLDYTWSDKGECQSTPGPGVSDNCSSRAARGQPLPGKELAEMSMKALKAISVKLYGERRIEIELIGHKSKEIFVLTPSQAEKLRDAINAILDSIS